MGFLGEAPTENGYAGYFYGNLAYTGELTEVSDRKFKKKHTRTGIRGILAQVKRIQSRTFEYKTEETPGLPGGKKYGFCSTGT